MTERCKCGRFIKDTDLLCKRCGEEDLVLWPVIEVLLDDGELEKIKERTLSKRDLQRLYSEQMRWKNGAFYPEFLERVLFEINGEYKIGDRERSWNG